MGKWIFLFVVAMALTIYGSVVITKKYVDNDTGRIQATKPSAGSDRDPILNNSYTCREFIESYLSSRMYRDNYSNDPSGKIQLDKIVHYVNIFISYKYPTVSDREHVSAYLGDLGDYCPAHSNDTMAQAIAVVTSRPSRYLQ
jgi:hypothetical protein